jgi:hypothetical protein
VCFISLTATCLERGLCRVSGFLAGSSFFVYAYHGMPLALAIKVVVRYLPPGSELEVIGLYLGSACVVIGIGLALYGGMVKVSIEQGIFSIQITLSEVDGSHL